MKKKSTHKKKKSGKGNLIKGMLHKLPASLINEKIFRKVIKEIMKGYAGVYVLYNDGKPYYVGLAKQLIWRLIRHLRDRHSGKWDSFSIFRIQRVRYLKDIESLLHQIVDAPGNKVKGRISQAASLRELVKRQISAIVSAHEEIFKGVKNVFF